MHTRPQEHCQPISETLEPEGSGPTCTNGQEGKTDNQKPFSSKTIFPKVRETKICPDEQKLRALQEMCPEAGGQAETRGLSLGATRRNTASVKASARET